MSEKAAPAWGYHRTKGAKLFEDGILPAGYADKPHPGQHPHDVELGIKPGAEKPADDNI